MQTYYGLLIIVIPKYPLSLEDKNACCPKCIKLHMTVVKWAKVVESLLFRSTAICLRINLLVIRVYFVANAISPSCFSNMAPTRNSCLFKKKNDLGFVIQFIC